MLKSLHALALQYDSMLNVVVLPLSLSLSLNSAALAWTGRASAVGSRIEAPKTPRGVVWGGVSFPTGEGRCPVHRIFFDFGSENGNFRCILDTTFTVQLFGLNAKASSRG